MQLTLSSRRYLAILTLLTAGVPSVSADQVKGFGCPPAGDPYDYEKCYDERGNPKPGYPKKIPRPFDGGEDVNDDGKKDRKGSTRSDLAGNKIECWCLQKSDKTPQQFAYAFVPAGTNERRWFGGCYFPNGNNNVICKGEIETNGPNKGKVKEYTSVCQDNIDWGPRRNDPPTGKKDLHFKYYNSGDNKGKVQKFKTEGTWEPDGTGPDGKPKYKYKETKRTECPITPPPATPQELLVATLEPGEIEEGFALGFGGTDAPNFTVLSVPETAPFWEFHALLPTDRGFLDDVPDVWTAIETEIHPGDEFTLTGSGFQAVWMSDEMKSAERGGWVLSEVDDEHATFVATTHAQPETGYPFGSFFVHSEAKAGTIRWAYMGEEIGVTGEMTGPAGETIDDIDPVDPPDDPIRPVADVPLRPTNDGTENNESATPAPRTPRQDPP